MNRVTLSGLDTLKNKAKKKTHALIRVGMSTCGIAAGAQDVFETLVRESEKRTLDVSIKRCGCAGMCSVEPLVEVMVAGVPHVIYGKVDARIAHKIIEEHIVGHQLVDGHIVSIQVD